jgi:hypothetical protein
MVLQLWRNGIRESRISRMLRIISCFTPLLQYSDTPILQGKGLCQGWNRFMLRLSENAHLPFDKLMALSRVEGLRYPHPSSLRRTSMYASFLGISEALHLDIFHQPLRGRFFDSLVRQRNRPVSFFIVNCLFLRFNTVKIYALQIVAGFFGFLLRQRGQISIRECGGMRCSVKPSQFVCV